MACSSFGISRLPGPNSGDFGYCWRALTQAYDEVLKQSPGLTVVTIIVAEFARIQVRPNSGEFGYMWSVQSKNLASASNLERRARALRIGVKTAEKS
jgi:hypothetical protein